MIRKIMEGNMFDKRLTYIETGIDFTDQISKCISLRHGYFQKQVQKIHSKNI